MSTNGSDFSAYDDFLKETDRDNRIGKHHVMVSSAVADTWPSGDPRIKVVVNLTTAGNAKADITFSELPSPETVKAESAGWDQGKRKAIAGGIQMRKALAAHYGKTPETLAVGDEFDVQTGASKKNTDGSYFVRVVAILPPGAAKGAVPGSAAADNVPF